MRLVHARAPTLTGQDMARLRGHVPGILRHPVGGGLGAVAVIAVLMLFVGTKLVADDFIRDVDLQQSQQIIHLSQTLHHSRLLPSDRDELQSRLPEIAASSEFDDFIQRTLFGLDIVRLDLYDLLGARLYSTHSGSAPEATAASEPFLEARRGIPTSAMLSDVPFTGANGETTTSDVLATFGLMQDSAPDDQRGGRPLAIFAVYGEVGESLGGLKTTIQYIVGVFFGGLTVIFIIVYRVSEASRRRLQDANDRLQEQYEAVKESRERMLAADEAAKRAIAEELHGAVQTKLYAVWMKLGGLAQQVRSASEEQGDAIDDIANEVDAIRENDIRKLSHRLHPSIVRVGALAGLRSLRDYYEKLVPVELIAGPEAERLEPAGASTIPENVRLAAYRIAELALANVVKHAKAGEARVRWDYEPERGALVLVVSDDGKGFGEGDDGPAAQVAGIGLTTINDYADALGGVVEVASAAGQGTVLTARIPFRPAEAPTGMSGDDSESAVATRTAGAAGHSRTIAAGIGAMAREGHGD